MSIYEVKLPRYFWCASEIGNQHFSNFHVVYETFRDLDKERTLTQQTGGGAFLTRSCNGNTARGC
jgi:hypothetical protein